MSEENPFLYWDAITAQRALLLDPETALQGNTLLSMETLKGEEVDFCTFVQNHLAAFLQGIRRLTRMDQDLLLGYYLLRKSQTQLAEFLCLTQTIASAEIRLAERALCAFFYFGGERPSRAQMEPILKKANLDRWKCKRQKAPPNGLNTAWIIDDYAVLHSFARVASLHDLPRPEIRRMLRTVSERLLKESQPMEAQLLGSWIEKLIHKRDSSEARFTNRYLAKQANQYRKDAACLGQFRIDLSDPELGQLFSPHANTD